MPRAQSGITFSKNFLRMLGVWSALGDKVAYALSTGYTMNGDFVVASSWPGDHIDLHGELLSYTPSGKNAFPRDTGGWEPDGRQTAKPGRLVRSLFDADSIENCFCDADFEAFANRVKALAAEQQGEFKLLAGEEIRAAYLESRAAKGSGSLDKSCMRYDINQPYFNIYVEHPDRINLLTMVNKRNLLIGRALVWTTDEEGKVLDRIYGADATVEAFRAWAREQGMPHRTLNSVERPMRFTFPQGSRDVRLSLSLPRWRQERYPYCDTFRYLFEQDGMLANHERGDRYYYYLQDTHGGPRLRKPCEQCARLIAPGDWMQDGMCHDCWQKRHCRLCHETIGEGAEFGCCAKCVKKQSCKRCSQFSLQPLYGKGYCRECAAAMTCYDCGRYLETIALKENKAEQVCPSCQAEREKRAKRRGGITDMPVTADYRYTISTSNVGTTSNMTGSMTGLNSWVADAAANRERIMDALLNERGTVVNLAHDWTIPAEAAEMPAQPIAPIARDAAHFGFNWDMIPVQHNPQPPFQAEDLAVIGDDEDDPDDDDGFEPDWDDDDQP